MQSHALRTEPFGRETLSYQSARRCAMQDPLTHLFFAILSAGLGKSRVRPLAESLFNLHLENICEARDDALFDLRHNERAP